MEHSDYLLIQQYKEGDEGSFSELISRYIDHVYTTAYRLSGNSHDADDITQETFVKVWKNLDNFQKDKNFKTWILRITYNTGIDLLRKKHNISFSHFDTESGNLITDSLSDTEPLPHELAILAEERGTIEKFIETLSPLYKEIITLYYMENLTLEDIGIILDRPTNTIKSQHRRALHLLRQFLENIDAPKP